MHILQASLFKRQHSFVKSFESERLQYYITVLLFSFGDPGGKYDKAKHGEFSQSFISRRINALIAQLLFKTKPVVAFCVLQIRSSTVCTTIHKLFALSQNVNKVGDWLRKGSRAAVTLDLLNSLLKT